MILAASIVVTSSISCSCPAHGTSVFIAPRTPGLNLEPQSQTQAHTLDSFSLDRISSCPRPVFNIANCVGSIAEHVQDDRMQLDKISDDGSEVLGESGPQNHPISLKIAQRQRNQLSHNLVQIEQTQQFPTFSMPCTWLTAEQERRYFRC